MEQKRKLKQKMDGKNPASVTRLGDFLATNFIIEVAQMFVWLFGQFFEILGQLFISASGHTESGYGLVGVDSWLRGCEFKSWLYQSIRCIIFCIYFKTIFWSIFFAWNDHKCTKRGWGWPIFKENGQKLTRKRPKFLCNEKKLSATA